MTKHLYVIGNGFDIHHGIKSSYSEFREWMQENHPIEMENFENAYGVCDEDWWNDFENQLATLNIIEYADRVASENLPDVESDHCDRTLNNAQVAVEDQLDELYSDLRSCFHDWIKQLNKPLNENKIELHIDNSVFMSFNYTKTLENTYGVKPEIILHIHGCIDSDENFIIGHGRTLDDLRNEYLDEKQNQAEDFNDESFDGDSLEEYDDSCSVHQIWAEEAAFNGVASQRKPVERLIYENGKFFRDLKDVTKVHVFGVSFSQVDAPYLNRIAMEAEKAEWEFSDYNNEHKRDIAEFVDNNAIRKYNIIDLNDILRLRH